MQMQGVRVIVSGGVPKCTMTEKITRNNAADACDQAQIIGREGWSSS